MCEKVYFFLFYIVVQILSSREIIIQTYFTPQKYQSYFSGHFHEDHNLFLLYRLYFPNNSGQSSHLATKIIT